MPTNEKVKLFREMLYIRMVEQEIANQYKNQEMRCPVHLSIGQEAVPVGISSCLSQSDHVVSAHRSHAHYLAKGGSLKRMIAELYGKVSGCARGKGGSMHLIDFEVNFTAAVPIVGSSISIGTGVGFGLKLSKNNTSKVVIYFGDGATEEGVFTESLDFAALHNLPVIFVCENNFYSVYTHSDQRQSSNRNLQKISEGHGVRAFQGNGNDVLEVQSITKSAIKYMEASQAPVLLEFDTYRWLEHCGPNYDDDLAYRPKGELQEWIDKCPIKLLKTEMISEGFPMSEIEGNCTESNRKAIKSAFEFSKSSLFPDSQELYFDVYSN